jgi:DNA-binding XRE family transcriptional regulator
MCEIAHMDGTTLGTRIAETRKALDLIQEHLATSVGIDGTALGLIEKEIRLSTTLCSDSACRSIQLLPRDVVVVDRIRLDFGH